MMIYGPPGTGKSTLVRALARRIDPTLMMLAEAHGLMGSLMGESSRAVARAFESCRSHPGFVRGLVFEENDALANERGGERSSARHENTRITITLMRAMEAHDGPVVFTTNRLGSLDPAFLRRCEYHVEMAEPSKRQCDDILFGLLGDVPTPKPLLNLPLVDAVAIAKRARRRAVLLGTSATDEAWKLAQ